jgi:hypothetical protein
MRKPIYIPKPANPRSFWVALAEFLTLMLMWGGMLVLAVFIRAMTES